MVLAKVVDERLENAFATVRREDFLPPGPWPVFMAELADRDGRVTAIEFAADLAQAAARNLSSRSNVAVVHGDGSTVAFDSADVIYVNAGATRPADNWLDRLNDGGRLILPLTTKQGFTARASANARHGGIFRITRNGDDFLAQWVCGVAIFPCEGMRDEISERAWPAHSNTAAGNA